MDLSPRHEIDDQDKFRRDQLKSRRIKVYFATLILVIVGGFVAIQGLRNATLFFRNVDEAIIERADLGERRFRLQGKVIPGTVSDDEGVTVFEIVHECEVAKVRHITDPPELFSSPWIPVVLEGRWTKGAVENINGPESYYFLSDRMLVKHTNEYVSVNEERLEQSVPDDVAMSCEFLSDLRDES
jgi:cytochrome c-type biogenesis protein CcmE